MSRAWLTIPSARPAAEANIALERWRNRGYGIALWCVDGSDHEGKICDVKLTGPKYPGWAASINILAAHVLQLDPECEWVIGGGDDTWTDPDYRADEIAAECYEYFDYSTFGVMQPTGDPWSDDSGKIIERIAGSPWMGREWCLRANGGRGPMWPEYFHMFADEHLQEHAKQLGVFWQRPDLVHYHDHWCRESKQKKLQPDFGNIKQAYSGAEWEKSKAIFKRMMDSKFAECAPL